MNEPSSLSRLLRPASVAIVGLSADRAKHGGRVLSFLKKGGFEGPVWGVHPKTPEAAGAEMFPSLRELPAAPDAVVLTIPPPSIPEVLEDAAGIGAGGAILFTGGFAETGAEGAALQNRIRDIARSGGVRLLGPNSAGIIHAAARTILSFLTCLERPADQIRSGPVGLITQSGGTGSFIHNLAAERGGGLAISVSTGNEPDIELGEVFAALVEHPEVRAIALILETIRNGPRFMEAARAAREAGKPVVALKIGRTEAGRGIMRTHTGALAGPERAYEAAFEALGIATARTPEELFEVAEIMARSPLPEGEGAGIITHSGGAAIMLADRAEELGIELPEPSRDLKDALAPLLQMGTAGNPADLGGIVSRPERYGEVIRLFLADPAYALVVPVSTPHPAAHSAGRARELGEIAREGEKPLPNLWLAGDMGKEGLDILRAEGTPAATSAESLLRAVRGLIRLGKLHRSPAAPGAAAPREEAGPKILEIIDSHRQRGRLTLSEAESKALIEMMGITAVRGEIASGAGEAAAAAARIGYPVVLKVNSPDIPHKSEFGGVRLNIGSDEELRRAWDEMMESLAARSPGVKVEGALIEEFAPGLEMILGAVRDETFGPMALVGTGGTLAEALDDVALALAPVSDEDAEAMIGGLRGARLLRGFRGAPPADEAGLAKLLARLSRIAAAYGDRIEEIDLNPVVFSGGRWRAADALIRLREKSQ